MRRINKYLSILLIFFVIAANILLIEYYYITNYLQNKNYSIENKDIGLPNFTGKMCYFNASMQCLISSKYFTNHFNKIRKGRLYQKVKKFINAVLCKNMIDYETSVGLLRSVRKGDGYYTGTRPDNSVKFIYDLLKQLDEYEQILKTFEITLQYFQGTKLVAYNSTSHHIEINGYSLEEMCIPYQIDNKSSHCLKYHIKSCSNIIIIEYNFFNENNKNLEENFKNNINQNIIINDKSYSLFGCIVHIFVDKDINYGHNIAYVKRSNKWILFDDEKSYIADSLDYVKESKYIILFYEKDSFHNSLDSM
ncbi:Ubiquitin carboxyl-terminal hydrolase 4 [Astathelohania contejeani]|uniref:Ubiquitin carboxyl-terminal hydrolase 4 n=1 Tax=Astathelohania contejeani TaxID=164912 RepID=A0ABQ7I105_9MICR|nr:Ubiquitin carboxyl-terminal hydrolase 4 [Thelohania contejeani]